MFRRVLMFAASGLIAGTAGLASSGTSVAASTLCTGVITGQTIQGSVVVPDGATCYLNNDVISGSITVGRNATLRMGLDPAVGAGDAAGDEMNGSRVGGSIGSNGAAQIEIFQSWIGGSASFQDTNGTDAGDSKDYFCETTVKSNVTVKGSGVAALWKIGDRDQWGADLCENGGNTIGGNVIYQDNHSDLTLSDNNIGGNVVVVGNTKTAAQEELEFDLGENTINRNLVCHDNSPKPVAVDADSSSVGGRRVCDTSPESGNEQVLAGG